VYRSALAPVTRDSTSGDLDIETGERLRDHIRGDLVVGESIRESDAIVAVEIA